jgi:hypothetical protein
MGWQDRDYARWTDEERRRFLGVGASRASASRRSVGVSECATVAVLVSAAVFALGHLPRGHPNAYAAAGIAILLIHLALYPWPAVIPDLQDLHHRYEQQRHDAKKNQQPPVDTP